MTTIIGVSGYAGSGKDEFAKVFVNEYGFTRIAFADVLRDMAYAIDPYVHTYDWTPPEPYDYLNFKGVYRLADLVDHVGWDEAKNEYDDVRRLLQRLGTEAGRDILGENIWVDTAFARAAADRIIVTDMRFPNELAAVKERGGTTVRIDRDGVGPRNQHASEISLDDAEFDYWVGNHGTLEELARTAREVAERVDKTTPSA